MSVCEHVCGCRCVSESVNGVGESVCVCVGVCECVYT